MSEVTAVPLRPIKKGSLTVLWAGIALAVLAAGGFAWQSTARQVAMSQPPAEFLASNRTASGVVTMPSGVQYKILEPGSGRKPTAADMTHVEYEGRLADGTIFDASALHPDTPAIFPVTGMIPGWADAIQQMQVGTRYRVWIPPELAFGEGGIPGKIPPNSLVIFDVKLLEVMPAPNMGGMGGMGGGGMGAGHGEVVPPGAGGGGM